MRERLSIAGQIRRKVYQVTSVATIAALLNTACGSVPPNSPAEKGSPPSDSFTTAETQGVEVHREEITQLPSSEDYFLLNHPECIKEKTFGIKADGKYMFCTGLPTNDLAFYKEGEIWLKMDGYKVKNQTNNGLALIWLKRIDQNQAATISNDGSLVNGKLGLYVDPTKLDSNQNLIVQEGYNDKWIIRKKEPFYVNYVNASYNLPTPSPIAPTIEATNNPTPEEIQKANQDEILKLMEAQESRWVEMGYLPDYTKNGEVLTQKTIEINGKQIEVVGFRIGMTEIWTDKELVDRTLGYYDGAQKSKGEVIVPNISVENWEYKASIVGACVNASNMGFGENVLGYLQTISENIKTNPDANMYTINEYKLDSKNSSAYHVAELPPIDGSLPVRFIRLNPTITVADVDRDKIYGGTAETPFNLPYYIKNGWAGVFVDSNGGITIAFDEVLYDENISAAHYNTDAALRVTLSTLVGVSESMRNPNYSHRDPFKYIVDLVLGPDTQTPLFVWDRK